MATPMADVYSLGIMTWQVNAKKTTIYEKCVPEMLKFMVCIRILSYHIRRFYLIKPVPSLIKKKAAK